MLRKGMVEILDKNLLKELNDTSPRRRRTG